MNHAMVLTAFESRYESSSMVIDFARSRRMRVAGYWIQRTASHCWTWCSNCGGARKEIDHVLVATLKIRLKSRKMAPSDQVRLDARRFRDESVAQSCQYKRELAESLGQPNDSDDPQKLFTDFKTEVLKVSERCLRDTSETSKSFLTKETPSRGVAGLDSMGRPVSTGSWNSGLYVRYGGTKRCKSVVSARQWRVTCGQLTRPAYKEIQTLRYSRHPPRCFTIKAAAFPVNVDGVRDADPSVSCDPPTLVGTRRALNHLESGNAPGGCGIYAEILRAREPPPFTLGTRGVPSVTGHGKVNRRVPFRTRGSS